MRQTSIGIEATITKTLPSTHQLMREDIHGLKLVYLMVNFSPEENEESVGREEKETRQVEKNTSDNLPEGQNKGFKIQQHISGPQGEDSRLPSESRHTVACLQCHLLRLTAQ